MAINYKKNVKDSFSKKEVNNSLWALGSIATWFVLPNLLKKVSNGVVDGWYGYATAFALTFGTGAVLGIPALRYTAIGLGAVHLAYAKLGGTMADLGIPNWRLGGDFANTAPNPNINSDTPALNGLSNNITLPNGYSWDSRPAYELENSSMGEYVHGELSEYVNGSLSGYVNGSINDRLDRRSAKRRRIFSVN